MKKIEIARNLIERNKDLICCPLCNEDIEMGNGNNVICKNNHNFDLAKTGYINLLVGNTKVNYTKENFESREAIYKLDIFKEMASKVSEIIYERYLKELSTSEVSILDIGCGEGSHTLNIVNSLKKIDDKKIQAIGMDIEKEGIKLASKKSAEVIWSVADLAKSPFKSEKIDIITNIFTPSNYNQFKRILKKEGILVKIVPGSEYLKEIRKGLYKNTIKENYSNEKIVDYFEEHFEIIHKENIIKTQKIEKRYVEQLINMTPLSWGASEESTEKLKKEIKEITLDWCVIIGKSK